MHGLVNAAVSYCLFSNSFAKILIMLMKSSCRLPSSCASVLKIFVSGIQQDSDGDVRTYYVLAVSMNSIEFAKFALSMSQKETASLTIRLYSSSLSRDSSLHPLDLDNLYDKTLFKKSNARLIMVFGCVVWRNQKTDGHVESEVVFAKYFGHGSRVRGPGQDLQ